MIPPPPDPADDPRLTAFLLGEEADPAVRAEMEILLRDSPAAAAWADDVRHLSAGLRAELGGDLPLPRPDAPRRPAAAPPANDRILAFPGRAGRWKLAALAAAVVAAAGFLTVWPMFLPTPPRRIPAESGGLVLVEPAPPEGMLSPAAGRGAHGAAAAGFTAAAAQRASAFVPNAGTESLGLVRAALERGERPPPETVRIEELVNHFLPGDPAAAAGVRLDAAAAPWNPAHLLVRVVFRAGPAATSGWQVRVEFNPDRVASWRLLGHDFRRAASAQPADDDAGAIPAGRAVTTFYEVIPAAARDGEAGEWLTVHAAWRGGAAGQAVQPLRGAARPFAEADAEFRFAAAVAAFGLALRDEPAGGGGGLARLREWVGGAEEGRQAEFLDLVERARRVREGAGRAGG